MPGPALRLADVLRDLSRLARASGWSDAEWARRAGLPRETLCRMRSRSSCDFSTLAALAEALGARVEVGRQTSRVSPDGLWPAKVDRALEARLIGVLATGSRRLEDWRPLGPPFFLAGLAVTLASRHGADRAGYLSLAEALHPGITEPRVHAQWLAQTPLSASRLLPMLSEAESRAA